MSILKITGDLIADGFIHGKIDVPNFDDVVFPHADDDGIDPKALDRLDILQQTIEQIVSPAEYVSRCMWHSADQYSQQFHNDSYEGFNSSFLVYLDPPLQNCIQIKNTILDKVNTIYAGPNEFVWLNQKEQYQHRVVYKDGQRRVIGFEYNIPWI
jgi:hypothetical protein